MLLAAHPEQRSHDRQHFVLLRLSFASGRPSAGRLRAIGRPGLRPPLRLTPLGTEDIHDREVDLRFFGQRHGCDDETRFSRGGHMPLTRGLHRAGPRRGATRVFNEAVTLVEVRLLGPLEVDVDGRILDVRRQKQRALLALLALRAGEVVPTDRLVDELWGEEPPKAAVGSLQNFVSELRKMLGADVLVTRSPGYLLDIPRYAVDVHRFGSWSARPGAKRRSSGRRPCEKRSGCGVGRPSRTFSSKTRWRPSRPARKSRVAAWEDRLEVELELGRQSQVIGELESLVAKHPLRERPVGLLMLALYRGGRQADALDAYRRCVRGSSRSSASIPQTSSKRLEQAILRHDKELDLPEAPRKRVPASEPDRRKTVTILFADLVDSTELGARLDPEVLRRVLDRYFELARAAIERHGGVVEKFIGDAAMAVFGIPTVHEDDALRAVRAACELREALAEPSEALTGTHGIPLDVRSVSTRERCSFMLRIPANPSPPVPRSTSRPDSSRPRFRARSSSVRRHIGWCSPRSKASLWTQSTWAARWAEFRFRTGSRRRRSCCGLWARPPSSAGTTSLARLQAAFAGAQAERRSRVVTVLGEAGVGKSRLAREFTASAGELPLVGRCVSYGEGATFLPLAQIFPSGRSGAPPRGDSGVAGR